VYVSIRKTTVPWASPEKCIWRAGVARGYLHRPNSLAAFLKNHLPTQDISTVPATGQAIDRTASRILGPHRSPVQDRGFRIELGEIESVISLYPGMREVVVIAPKISPAIKNWWRTIVHRKRLTSMALRTHIKVRCRLYGSSGVRAHAESAADSNGKVDRVALPATGHSRISRKDSYVARYPPTVSGRIWVKCWALKHPRE